MSLGGPLATAQGIGVPAAGPWRVAILMGSDPALPAMQQHDRALRAALLAAAPAGVTFFTDTLDAYRFDYRDVAPEFLALQRKKYAGQPVDLVIGIGEPALGAIRDQRDALWPGVPLVLSGVDSATIGRERLPDGVAVASWQLDIEGTLSLIEGLQPSARRLVVIGGQSAFDRGINERVTAAARARGRWEVQSWSTLTIAQLSDLVSVLDRDTAVFFTAMSRDSEGRTTFPGDAISRISAVSGAPVYGLFASYVGRGIVAGSVFDFEDLGRSAAELAIGALRGVLPPGGAQRTVTAACKADYTQVAAHRLPVLALPSGCDVLNPPRNLWTEYRGFVLAAGAVVALQSLTIGGLLVQRRRRRQAEIESRQRSIELARAMRFAAMGELTASIAHEINQPLGAILANADAAAMLLRSGNATPESLREILSDIRRDDLRATEVIRRLRNLLGKHESEHAPAALHGLLREAVALLEPEARRRAIPIEVALEAVDDRMLGDAVQLQQLVINLSINAMDAMESTPPGSRRLTIGTRDTAESVVLTVADRGPGIPIAERQRIFESFYTTKPRGMGLGLPIVRAIADAHRAQLTVDGREGGGTVFSVRLPRRLDGAASANASIEPAAVAPGAA